MTNLIPPAALQHAAVKLRRTQADYGLEMHFDMPTDRYAELVVEHAESGVRLWFPAERLGRRWRLRKPQATQNGDALDMTDGLDAVLKLLNAHEHGEAGTGAVTAAAGARRNTSVEVRRATVIRT